MTVSSSRLRLLVVGLVGFASHRHAAWASPIPLPPDTDRAGYRYGCAARHGDCHDSCLGGCHCLRST